MNDCETQRNELICCTTTVGSVDDANRIATALIDQSVAACVQIDAPMQSHYQWQGKRCCDTVYRLTIKSTRAAWADLERAIQEVHPYDEPQIIAMPVIEVSEATQPG